jgi:hypothetical protein
MHVKLPNTEPDVEDELPPISTYVPDAPPVQVTGSPAERVTVAAAAWLVQVNGRLGNVIMAVKGPIFFPPLPMNVYVPLDKDTDASCPS